MIIFLFALLCILFLTASLRLHPFLNLVIVSVFAGILAGEPLATVEAITGGLGSVFSRFAIITCGSVIGILLQGTGGMSLIASDIIHFSRNPLLALNVFCFLFSVPLMCYILAYVIFVPITKELAARLDNPSISTATALALEAVASFNLVYLLRSSFRQQKNYRLTWTGLLFWDFLSQFPLPLQVTFIP